MIDGSVPVQPISAIDDKEGQKELLDAVYKRTLGKLTCDGPDCESTEITTLVDGIDSRRCLDDIWGL